MAFIMVIPSGFKSPQQMENLIKYIMQSQRHQTDGLVGGFGISTVSEDIVFDEMMNLKKTYKKTSGRMMKHIIVSPSDAELRYLSKIELYKCAMEICCLFAGYQTLFAIHLETGRPHIHIAVNTVSFLNGLKLPSIAYGKLRADINGIISAHIPASLLPCLYGGVSTEPRVFTMQEAIKLGM